MAGPFITGVSKCIARLGLVVLLAAVAVPAKADVYSYLGPDGSIHIAEKCPAGKCKVLAVVRKTPAIEASPYYRSNIKDGSLLNGLPGSLVQAVIKVESNFNPKAVSPKGAMGLMQLMPETCRIYGVADPFNPGENIRGGASYLRDMIDRFGDLPRALAAYNAGPSAVEKHGGIPPYEETQAFVKKVLQHYRDWSPGKKNVKTESSKRRTTGRRSFAVKVEKGSPDKQTPIISGSNPQTAQAFYDLAEAGRKAGDWAQAIAYYDKTVRLDPDFKNAYYNLASIYEKIGRPDLAVLNLQEYLRLESRPERRKLVKKYIAELSRRE